MYFSYDVDGEPMTLSEIKSLSFSTEADLTLSSLPVDTLQAEAATEAEVEAGRMIDLYGDDGTLWAHFTIVRAYHSGTNRLRIEAQSLLALLDRWEVGAARIRGTFAAAVEGLLNSVVPGAYIVPYAIDAALQSMTVDGFFPRQTARERLLWFCACVGAYVQQSFCDELKFHPLPVPPTIAYGSTLGTLIPISDTFMRPEISEEDPVQSVAFDRVWQIMDTEEYQDMESAEDESGNTWYWLPLRQTYTRTGGQTVPGREIQVGRMTTIGDGSGDYPAETRMAKTYFMQTLVRADVVYIGGEYLPGDYVRVYTDEDRIYLGFIRSMTFTFGLMAKARLEILCDPRQLPVTVVTIVYQGEDRILGQRTEVLPDGELYEYENPDVDGYTTGSGSVSGVATGGAVTENVSYTQIPPGYIQLAGLPMRVYYRDGETINFRGLKVEAHTATGALWTNGGQWQNGYIPLEALTFPVTVAVAPEYGVKTLDGAMEVDGVWITTPLEVKVIQTAAEAVYSADYALSFGTFNYNSFLSLNDPDKGTPAAFDNPCIEVIAHASGCRLVCCRDSTDWLIAGAEPFDGWRHRTIVQGFTGERTHPDCWNMNSTQGGCQEYTYDGRTVYWKKFARSSLLEAYIPAVGVTENALTKELAWFMLYGGNGITGGMMEVPVQWTRAGAAAPLETHFNIGVNMEPDNIGVIDT